MLTPLAAGALMMATSPAALAIAPPAIPSCTLGPTIITCTGDLEDGVHVVSPDMGFAHDTLNIYSVDPPGIAPPMGVDGISFEAIADLDITIDADLSGTAGIVTTGNDADGIFAQQDGGVGAVSVTSTGAISTMGDGADGIYAQQYNGDGAVSVTSTGDILSLIHI